MHDIEVADRHDSEIERHPGRPSSRHGAVVLVSPSYVNHAEIESRLFGRHVGVIGQLSRLDPQLGNLELELELHILKIAVISVNHAEIKRDPGLPKWLSCWCHGAVVSPYFSWPLSFPSILTERAY